jgi:PAS domain S-box-containing protein
VQPFYKRFSVVTGFILLLLLLVANSIVLRRQLSVQVTNQVWVYHTQEVLLEVTQTESLLKDAETGQRGYLYTHEASYLAPYNLAVTEIDSHITRLSQLVADNPDELANVARLRLLAKQKLNELSTTIQLDQSGNPDAARALVLTNRGQFTMEKIRALTTEMLRKEEALNAARTADYWQSVRVTIACVYLASGLAGAGLALLAYFVLREINLRERHAAQVRQREEWFRVTLTGLGDGVIATDERGNVTFVNPVAEKLTGRSSAQANGRPITDVFPIFNEVTRQPVDNPVKKVMELGCIVGLANHTVLQHADGSLVAIEDSAAPIHDDRGRLVGVVLVFRDATAERKSQELMRKTEKLAAAARLAATVAHEINNPLEAVCNLIYLAKNRPGLPPDIAHDLTLAEHELDRVSHITRQTLGFYRESKSPDALDVPMLVDSVLKLFSSKLKSKNISLECVLEQCPPVQGWSGELKQLISNLISNAADAVEMDGTLKVHVSCVERSGDIGVRVRVEDNGHGIASQDLQRIFEPFYTTKKDVGTGLGLWVSKAIAERHGGTIEVQSRVGDSHGTVFTIVLPCVQQSMAEAV